ncbi:hypothetical protein [Kingella sp. (in: b-proteobacteria)]|uniref:hypothetical protein n=1 Tax=Kingella sp. (in: b-proteobacteria) TaxID=2020713 RepID=UPI0026DC9274|nr:hypothetical protein [Kingella sp. (in: b-proteobacteria)]MDO4658620.1 hypothetical protein [Kingella sp. (in: b-proteobacteria)]
MVCLSFLGFQAALFVSKRQPENGLVYRFQAALSTIANRQPENKSVNAELLKSRQ